jgi:hypothetical protein
VESGDNVWRIDIAGVDDIRHACEALLKLWTQEPVSVRDDSNPEHCAHWVPDRRDKHFGPITVGDHQSLGRRAAEAETCSVPP